MPLIGQDGSSGGEGDSVVPTPHFSVVGNREEAVFNTEGVGGDSPIGGRKTLTPYHRWSWKRQEGRV